MSPLEPLAPDQRAVVVARPAAGTLLRRDRRAARDPAPTRCAPAPTPGWPRSRRRTGCPSEVTGPLADYLLGQQRAARRRGDARPARRVGARARLGGRRRRALAGVAPRPLPEIPGRRRSADADAERPPAPAPAPAAARRGRARAAPPPSRPPAAARRAVLAARRRPADRGRGRRRRRRPVPRAARRRRATTSRAPSGHDRRRPRRPRPRRPTARSPTQIPLRAADAAARRRAR